MIGRRTFAAAGAALAGAALIGASGAGATAQRATAQSASLRLEWVKQTQFAGFLVADQLGWYKKAGVDLTIKPAGPSVFPQQQVATGADTFGVPQVQMTIGAISNGAPLVTVMQYHQDSESVYVARKSSGIRTLKDVRGKRVGLWFGGNQFEFYAMLKDAGIPANSVHIVPQGFTVTPFLEGRYDLSQATPFNELGLIEQKIPASQLVLLHARDYHSAMLGDGIVTTADEIKNHPDVVQAVVTQSIRGWQWALNHPQQAARIAVEQNKELSYKQQLFMLQQNAKLICEGPTLDPKKGIGWIDKSDFVTAQKILLGAKQIKRPIDVDTAFTNRFVQATPLKYRQVDCKRWR